jgi:plasmid stabilization system protein ParE
MASHSSTVIWSPEALDDVDHLWEYYAGTAGRVIADKLLREIAKVIATIDEYPLQDGLAMKSGQACVRSSAAPTLCSIA